MSHVSASCRRPSGLPPPPPTLPRALRRGDAPPGDPPHFWRGGPTVWRRLERPRRIRSTRGRDGRVIVADHEVLWYLDRVVGVSRKTALTRLYDVLLRGDGWL